MRIALFSDTIPPQVNGVSLTLARLTGFLVRQGCRTLVVGPDTRREASESRDPIHPNGRARTVHVSGVPLPRYPELRLTLPWSSEALRAARAFRPDVVHVLTEFPIGWMGLRIARELGVPVVSSFHTDFPRYIRYYGLGMFSRPLWGYLHWFHSRTALTFCPSEVTRRELRRRGFDDVRLWGRGVDLERFHPDRRDPGVRAAHGPPDAVHLLYVGRLAPEKDLDLLLQTMRGLESESGLHLVVTGDGPYAAEARVRAPGNTTFTGYLTGRELAATYASADLFVFPSRTETYGNAVLEALASGLPVIAFAEGGVLENVRDEANGLLVPPGDTAAFGAAIRRLARDPALRSRLGAAARAWAERRTWDRAFEPLLAGYREVAGLPAPEDASDLVPA